CRVKIKEHKFLLLFWSFYFLFLSFQFFQSSFLAGNGSIHFIHLFLSRSQFICQSTIYRSSLVSVCFGFTTKIFWAKEVYTIHGFIFFFTKSISYTQRSAQVGVRTAGIVVAVKSIIESYIVRHIQLHSP